jgi:ketosteroid isomerase-like protein
MTTTTQTNVRIEALYDYIRTGRILEAMDEFYADNVVMTEPYHTTEGKAANIEREKQFLASVKSWEQFDVKATAIDGNVSLSEQQMQWTTTEGKVMHVEQIAVARWENGKIVHERFYYNMG